MISLSPVSDKIAMKLRYERALKEEDVIEEENILRTEYGINPNVGLM